MARKGTLEAAATRLDLKVRNERPAFILASAGLRGRGISPVEPSWTRAIAAADILPVEVFRAESFIVRVVLSGALRADESGEWVGRLAGAIRVPDGKLAIVGGGIEYLAESQGEALDRWVDQYVQTVDVPPGDHGVELLAYVHGVCGERLLEHATGGEVGAKERLAHWFRRTRPDAQVPVWLQSWLRADPGQDPENRDEWARKPTKRERERAERTRYVDLVLRLSPLDPSAARRRAPDGCWIGLDAWEVRRPERCPLGIRAEEPSDAVPETQEPAGPPPPLETVDVLARVGKRSLAPVAGGPVEHPIERIDQVYKLAWLATDAADPEIRIELPRGKRFAPDAPFAVAGAALAEVKGGVRIGFGASGAKWAQLRAVEAAGAALAGLPDGAVVELVTSPDASFFAPDEDDGTTQDRNAGVQRYRGPVRRGVWRIEKTFPRLDAATLREALDLAATVDSGKSLALRDDAEAAAVRNALARQQFLFSANPLTGRGLKIGLKKKDVGLLHFIAVEIFRARWGTSVWPSYVEAEDDGDGDDAAGGGGGAIDALIRQISEKLGGAIGKAAAPRGARERIFEGKIGAFDRVDLRADRPLEAEWADTVDEQLVDLGYTPLGDLVCSRFPEVIVRGYAHAGGHTWGAYLCGVLESTFDFVTHFAKDAGLTTTLKGGGPTDEPGKRIYRSRHPKLNFHQLRTLHERHERRKPFLARKLGRPLETVPTLLALAQAIDRGVARELGLG